MCPLQVFAYMNIPNFLLNLYSYLIKLENEQNYIPSSIENKNKKQFPSSIET